MDQGQSSDRMSQELEQDSKTEMYHYTTRDYFLYSYFFSYEWKKVDILKILFF